MDNLIEVVTIKPNWGGSYTVPVTQLEAIMEEIKLASHADFGNQTVTFRFHRMTREEFESLANFDDKPEGW